MFRKRSSSRGLLRSGLELICFTIVIILFTTPGLRAGSSEAGIPTLQSHVYVPGNTTKRDPSLVSQKAIERLNGESEKNWEIVWDRLTGLPREMKGVSKEYSGDPVFIAMEFAKEYKDLLTGTDDPNQLANYSFQTLNHGPDSLYYFVSLGILFNGRLILAGSIWFYIYDDGRIRYINDGLKPIGDAPVEPTLSHEDAEHVISQAACPDGTVDFGFGWEMGIYPSDPPRLVYRTARGIGALTWYFLIDANTGEIVSSTPNLAVKDWVTSPFRKSKYRLNTDSAGQVETYMVYDSSYVPEVPQPVPADTAP